MQEIVYTEKNKGSTDDLFVLLFYTVGRQELRSRTLPLRFKRGVEDVAPYKIGNIVSADP